MWLQATVQPRSGAKFVFDYVVFQDDRYLYPLLLQSPCDMHDENVETLRPVVSSVMPIPRSRSQRVPRDGVLSWMTE